MAPGKPATASTLPTFLIVRIASEMMTMTNYELADMSIEQLNLALDIQGLTPGQKLVLLVLANRANKTFEAWPSIGSIARQTCLSRSGVKKSLRQLKDRGLLIKKLRRNRANVYRLTLGSESTKGSLSDLQEEQGKGHPVTDGGSFRNRQKVTH